MISGTQVKMARAALGWTSIELAANAKVSPTTVLKFENGEDVRSSTLQKLETVLRQAGITFLKTNSAGQGVRVRT